MLCFLLDDPQHKLCGTTADREPGRILPVESRHPALLTTLANHQRDPFDRLLIAQSLVEGIPIVRVDEAFDPYGVTRLW